MRYAGGMLGGTWLASFVSDLGAGIFDGAYLVENFENLNPANTFWDKYYNLYANVDTEPPRFLEFERWWGGFFLMNREEIEWITRNLFVGNKLWTGDTRARAGKIFDLRDIKAPIILFASMGDNITPPQQAFNWVADVYGSTDEIKARGQVIVGLLHEGVGHLGIFVSGKSRRKSTSRSSRCCSRSRRCRRALRDVDQEHRATNGEVEYDVEFNERRLEEIAARLNRFERADEKPFEAVATISEFNQRAYELFGRPLVQAMANECTAKLGREFIRCALSAGRSPTSTRCSPGWAAAEAVKAQRHPSARTDPPRKPRRRMARRQRVARLLSRSARRDERGRFFQTYGNVFSLYVADRARRGRGPGRCARAAVREGALASIGAGGYPEALARAACCSRRRASRSRCSGSR